MHATIVILPGDGIGPEVIAEGVKVVRAVAHRWGHDWALPHALIGGAALDASGASLPAATLAACRSADAVLLGAVGGPRWDNPAATDRPERGLLALRQGMDVFANLRPVRVHPALFAMSPLRPALLHGVDMLIVRELTGGIYFGAKQRSGSGSAEQASDVCSYTAHEIERVVRIACDLARARRGKLTSVDKANVLETSRLWRSVTTRIVQHEYPDLQLEHLLVDAAAMHLLRRPADFDVLVTENMFGDILSDEAAMLAGSLGLSPSASLGLGHAAHRQPGLYEPIHGSAPDIAGQNIANPLGTIGSVALLLRHSLGLSAEAAAVEAAIECVITAGQLTADVVAPGQRAYSTSEVGDAVVRALMEN